MKFKTWSKGHALRAWDVDHRADAFFFLSSQYPTMADKVVLPIPNFTIPQNLFAPSNPVLKHLHDIDNNARKDFLRVSRPTVCIPLDIDWA